MFSQRRVTQQILLRWEWGGLLLRAMVVGPVRQEAAPRAQKAELVGCRCPHNVLGDVWPAWVTAWWVSWSVLNHRKGLVEQWLK